jgi:hypothetical protein
VLATCPPIREDSKTSFEHGLARMHAERIILLIAA